MTQLHSRAALVMTALAAAGLVFQPARAAAVSPEAERLFLEGRRLLLEAHYAEACARFSESYQADASSGTLLNLALCNEKIGKSATALSQYRETAQLAVRQGRQDRASTAMEKAEGLERTVPRLTLAKPKSTAGLEVSTDGGTLDEMGWNVPLPVDPGTHQVIARAPGRRTWTIAVDLREGERRTVEIPELEPEGAPSVVRVVPQPAAAIPSRSSNVDLYVAVSGGILFIAGGVLWSVAVSKFKSAGDACNTFPGCTTEQRDSRVTTIQRLELAAFGTWIAAGALVAGAAVHHWWGKRSATPRLAIAPASWGGPALSLDGEF